MKGKRIIAILTMAIMLLAIPMTASAASNPYKDVTKKAVGKDAYNAITYVKSHKGYTDVIFSAKFKPSKKITRAEFLVMLANFYGDKNVPVTMTDVRKANKTITAKYACGKMVDVAERLGIEITWAGNGTILTRALASQYLRNFAKFDSAFKPIK